MPKNFLYETAVTIDHEDNVMLVDTTVTSVATALIRAGFVETTKPNTHPYRRFLGQADQFRFRKPKGQRLRGFGNRPVQTPVHDEKLAQISTIRPQQDQR